jgi:hypothetical protein
MSNPIAAGCSEMVSDDIAMDGESSTIDSDIHHREWDPSLRILPISPTDHRSLPTEASTAQYFEAVWNLNKKQSNNAAKLKSFRLWCRQRVFGIVCLKGCLPSLQLTVMVSMVHGGQQGQGSRSSDQNT